MIPQATDWEGNLRKLGWVFPSEETGKLRATVTSIQSYRSANGLSPLIPRQEWVEVDYISPLGKRCISDQQSCGGCTGWSCGQAGTRQRLMRGLAFKALSGAAIYAQINGGQDNGSNIIDSMNAIEQNGTCLQSEMDFPNIYSNQIPQDKLLYKEAALKVTVGSFDECMTALMMGMLPQFPVNATSKWIHNTGYDENGVADLYYGRSSNHSVHGAATVCINGVWYIIMPNTWNTGWGPFAQQNPSWYTDYIARNNIVPFDSTTPLAGCCLLSEAHIDNCEIENDGYAHVITLPSSSDSVAPTPMVS